MYYRKNIHFVVGREEQEEYLPKFTTTDKESGYPPTEGSTATQVFT